MAGRTCHGLEINLMQITQLRRVLGTVRKFAHLGQNPLRIAFGKHDADVGVSFDYPAGTGMLAQYQTMRHADFSRIERLIIERIFQQTVNMDTGFMGKYRRANDALVRSHTAPRSLATIFDRSW